MSGYHYSGAKAGWWLYPSPSTLHLQTHAHLLCKHSSGSGYNGNTKQRHNNTIGFRDIPVFYIEAGFILVMEKKILCRCSNTVFCVVVHSPEILDCGKNSHHGLTSDCCSSRRYGQNTVDFQRFHHFRIQFRIHLRITLFKN